MFCRIFLFKQLCIPYDDYFFWPQTDIASCSAFVSQPLLNLNWKKNSPARCFLFYLLNYFCLYSMLVSTAEFCLIFSRLFPELLIKIQKFNLDLKQAFSTAKLVQTTDFLCAHSLTISVTKESTG